ATSARLHVATGPVYLGADPAEEVDRLQVLTTAELVGDPLATLSGVVEVEHRGHSVDAQAVDVIPVQPEESAGDQEALHFMAAVVEHIRAPFLVHADSWVRVLIEVRPVE